MPGVGFSFNEYSEAMKKESKPLFTTSKKMLENGMCLCEKCGLLTNIDYKFCTRCEEIIMITKK